MAQEGNTLPCSHALKSFGAKTAVEMANMGISQNGFNSAEMHAPFVLAQLRERDRLAARSLPGHLVTDQLVLELPLPASCNSGST